MVDLHQAGARLRSYRPEPSPPVAEIVRRRDRRARRRRATAAGAASTFIAALVVIIVAVTASGGQTRDHRVAVGNRKSVPNGNRLTVPSATAAQLAAGKWSTLPAAPIIPRDDASVVWTGQEMIVWGGASGNHGSQLHSDGAAYDPRSDHWRALPPAPLSPRDGQSAVWTGSEVLIWGGYDQVSVNAFHVTNDGAAYNPATNTWRPLPAAPLSARADVIATWTGSSMVVLGGHPAVLTDTIGGFSDGAAYDPVKNRWQHVDPPGAVSGHPLVWRRAVEADGQLLAWSEWSSIASGGADLFTYAEQTNQWRLVPSTPGSPPDVQDALWTGQVALVRGAPYVCGSCLGPSPPEVTDSYDPVANTWTKLPADPLANTHPVSTWTTGSLFSFDVQATYGALQPGDASAYNPTTRQWTLLPAAPFACNTPQPPTWTGHEILLYCPHTTIGAGPMNDGLAYTPGP